MRGLVTGYLNLRRSMEIYMEFVGLPINPSINLCCLLLTNPTETSLQYIFPSISSFMQFSASGMTHSLQLQPGAPEQASSSPTVSTQASVDR